MKRAYKNLSVIDKSEIQRIFSKLVNYPDVTNFLIDENPYIFIYFKPIRYNIQNLNSLISKFKIENEKPLFEN